MSACIFGLRGSPMMLRLPSARGPNSMRPSNQPTIFPSASSDATRSVSSSRVSLSKPAPDRRQVLLDLVVGEDGPR